MEPVIIREILAKLIRMGEQGILGNIPLPQFIIEQNKDKFDILIYSKIEDFRYHQKLLLRVKNKLNLKGIQYNVVRAGITYPIYEPHLRFWGTRLRLNLKSQNRNL